MEAITADGRHAILSGPGDCGLGPATGHARDYYLRDLDTGQNALVDPGLGGGDDVDWAGASGNGQLMCFNLNGTGWIWDRVTGTTKQLIPRGSDQPTYCDSMSPDGHVGGHILVGARGHRGVEGR